MDDPLSEPRSVERVHYMQNFVASVVLVSELDKLGMELPFNIRRRAEVDDIITSRQMWRDHGAWKESAAGPCVAWQDEDGELVCIVHVNQENVS